MRIIGFLLLTGVAILVLNFGLSWVTAALSAVVLKLIKADRYSTQWFVAVTMTNVFVLYLLAGLLSRIVCVTYAHDQSVLLFIVYALIGTSFMYGITINAIKEKRENGAYREEMAYNYSDHSTQEILDIIKTLSVVPFFLLVLFIYPLNHNPLIELFFNICRWVASLPYVGWIIGGFGFLLSVSNIFTGLVHGPLTLAGIVVNLTKSGEQEVTERLTEENNDTFTENEV